MTNFEIAITVFFLVYGVTFISAWIVMVIKRSLPAVLLDNKFMFYYHLLSEMIPAILGIVIALFMLKRAGWATLAVYFNLGFMFCFAFHGASYSLFEKKTPPYAILTVTMFVLCLFFLTWGLVDNPFRGTAQYLLKFGLFTLGALQYLLFNIAAEYGKGKEWAVVINVNIFIVVLFFYSVKIIQIFLT